MTETVSIDRNALISELGLTIESVFVPCTQSRKNKEPMPTLNWRITLRRDSREILATDYTAGMAHCPAYKCKDAAEKHYRINWECETGFKAQGVRWGSKPEAWGSRNMTNAILPNTLDVLASLLTDSDVLDTGGFEEWARDLGYDADSRKAEQIYQDCLGIALKLRNGLGEANLAKLREAFQDY